MRRDRATSARSRHRHRWLRPRRRLARHPREGGGCDQVDLDAVRRACGGQAAGEPDDRRPWPSRTRGSPAARTLPRRGHDDAAVALFDHVRPGGPGGVERADHVDGEVTGQVLGVGSGEPAHLMMPALLIRMSTRPNCSMADIDRATWPPASRGHVAVVGDRRSRLRRRSPRPTRYATPASVADAVHRPTQIVDDHAGAPVGEQQRIGPADAPPGTGDDRDPSLEAVLVHYQPVSRCRWFRNRQGIATVAIRRRRATTAGQPVRGADVPS